RSLLPPLRDGDLVIVRRQSAYHVGDIVAYRVPQGDASAGARVIHRIIGGSERHGWVIQGDNRTAPDMWRPHQRDMIGKLFVRLPQATIALQLLRSPLLLACLAAGLAVAFLVPGAKRAV